MGAQLAHSGLIVTVVRYKVNNVTTSRREVKYIKRVSLSNGSSSHAKRGRGAAEQGTIGLEVRVRGYDSCTHNSSSSKQPRNREQGFELLRHGDTCHLTSYRP